MRQTRHSGTLITGGKVRRQARDQVEERLPLFREGVGEGHHKHKARTLTIVDGFGPGFVAVVGPSEGVGVDLGVEEYFEGAVVLDAELVAFVDVDLGEEGLVVQASVGVVAVGVDLGAVGEQVEGVVEVGSGVGSYTATVSSSGPVTHGTRRHGRPCRL